MNYPHLLSPYWENAAKVYYFKIQTNRRKKYLIYDKSLFLSYKSYDLLSPRRFMFL